MDIVVNICSWTTIGLAICTVLSGPFLIGKKQTENTPLYYIVQLFVSVIVAIVAGRALGWW